MSLNEQLAKINVIENHNLHFQFDTTIKISYNRKKNKADDKEGK